MNAVGKNLKQLRQREKLTQDALAERLQSLLGADTALHFYDAAAPLVTAESVDMDKAWFGSRYDRGTADYVNRPMTEAEHDIRDLKGAA